MSAHLAIVISHPIQYYSPIFKILARQENISIKVFYTWSQALQKVDDPDFGQSIEWDIPLLEGYEWEAVNNTAKKPSPKSFSGIKNPGLIKKIKAFNPDAILVFGWNYQSHLQIMHYFKGKVPVWFRGDSTLLDYNYTSLSTLLRSVRSFTLHLSPLSSYLKFKFRSLFLRWVYTHVDKAFYVGACSKSYFRHHGLKEEQLVYAPHAVDNERFFDNEERQYEKKARQWRREIGIPDEAKVILFAGKFEPKKNPGILIDAVIQYNQQINKSTNQLHAVLTGSGILESQLRQQVKDHSYIHFIPFQNQSQMPVVYRLGDIFCLPSQGPGETWGLAVNEAFACSRPAIVSDKVGCHQDLIKDSETGYIFKHDEVNSLIKKVHLANNLSLKTLGKNALQHIKKFSIHKIVESIETTINTQ